jgi:hypothetical protein
MFLENAVGNLCQPCLLQPASGKYGNGPSHGSETRGSEDRTEKFHNIFYPDVPGFNA